MKTVQEIKSEAELFRAYRDTNDKALRDEIVRRYVYIPEIVAKKFARNNRSYNNGIDYDDIYQVACMGLLYAADRFDPDKGIKFASFATPTIIGEVRRFYRDKGFIMKVPGRLYDIFRKAERIKRTESDTNIREVARILGVSEDTVREAYKMGDAAFVRSIESEFVGEDDNIAVTDTIGREDSGYLVIENSDFIHYCEKRLTETEREFVRLRYYEEKTQREVGEGLGMTQIQVSRMEKKILKKLRSLYFGD